ncbi:MAG: putative bifunctional diguanylate cyclase/phosphodiesterase, partial [Pyrinomonadaceae bacterium]
MIAYFAGASAEAAGYVADGGGVAIVCASFLALLVITLVSLAYQRSLKESKASARLAASAERARAEQAERHVAELKFHIAEQERIGRELQESKEHFRLAAYHDPLTGLPNRALFVERLRVAIERARWGEGYLFAVLFLDLDRFKNINDSLGHTCGDQLLVAVAHRLQGCVRQSDTVARFGGDEFAVLLDGIREPEDAGRVAAKIQHQLRVPLDIENHRTSTTASIGIALSTAAYERPEDVLRDADTATYRAKEGGRARHEVFDRTMHVRAVSLLRIENDLRVALERGEFVNYYQPVFSLKTGQLVGFEALVRWQHPERGMVSPAEFIPVAEETGMIVPLGLCVLEEA